MKDQYVVLKGRPAELTLDDDSSPHIEIKVRAGGAWYRVAINARSGQHPNDLLYCKVEPFTHRITRLLPHAPDGVTVLAGKLRALSLDYAHGGFVKRARMRPAPYVLDGASNDLREFIGGTISRAIKEKATLYAFGEAWGPEPERADFYFGFKPGQGVHDIHMNQGSRGPHRGKNRPRQDGGLLIHFAKQNRWVGLFLAFQTQSWRTDRRTGHPLR